MKDYSAHQLSQFGLHANLGVLARFLTNWQARRAVASLDRLDDFMLQDIGVTREEVRQAAKVPLWQNAASVLNDVSRARQLKFGRQLYRSETKSNLTHPAGSPFRPS